MQIHATLCQTLLQVPQTYNKRAHQMYCSLSNLWFCEKACTCDVARANELMLASVMCHMHLCNICAAFQIHGNCLQNIMARSEWNTFAHSEHHLLFLQCYIILLVNYIENDKCNGISIAKVLSTLPMHSRLVKPTINPSTLEWLYFNGPVTEV